MSAILYSVVQYIAGGRGLIGSIKAVGGSIVVYKRVRVSIRGLNRSIVVYRGVRGLRNSP